MAKTRIIAKSCPKCEQQVAVASKVCKCGYEFFSGKLRSTTSAKVKIDERRRTGRIRREKPNFYDSQQFEKKKKRQRRARQLVEEEEEKVVDKKESIVARAKRRLKKKEESGNDPLSKLPEEKKLLASLILAEINRKIGVVQWKPE